jgi:riboflavin biosynthesis pyrimidine reductase
LLRVNFVSSLDGAVAVDGLSAELSSPADKVRFRLLRRECDALLVGAGTFRKENYRPLTLDAERRAWRLENGLTAYPTLVLVSRSMDLDPEHPALARAPMRPIVLTPGEGTLAVAEVIRFSSLADGLAQLEKRGLKNVLCEGGPELFGALTREDLVDELFLTLSPLLAGPGASRIISGVPHEPRRMRLSQVDTAEDGMLLLKYERQRGS